MAITNHSFIMDGGEKAIYFLPIAIERAIHELEIKTGLTIFVKDVTIERNPHGDGMWNYTLKVNTHETE